MNTRIRTIIISLIAASSFATATIAPAVSLADAKPGTPVTCSGGGKPGDIRETSTEIYINGQWIEGTMVKDICGNDGQWHHVIGRAGGNAGTPPLSTPPVAVGQVTRAVTAIN